MKFMGIDYGTKRVGIALSDSSNAFALPYKVIQNSKSLLEDLNEIICEKEVDTVVMGESKNFQGKDNAVMKDINNLKESIENNLHKTVILEPEFMTSQQAASVQGEHALLDASAAAIILQSYLDRIKNNK